MAQPSGFRLLLAAGVATFSAAGFAANASDNPPVRAVAPSPLAEECNVPGATLSSLAPLPKLVDALEQRGTARVLAIGSSSTVGVGASSPFAAYPSRLEVELKRDVAGLDVEIINRGVSGEVAAATAERLKYEVAKSHPDLVIWQVGTNDALMRVPVEDFEATLVQTLRWLKINGFDVVLVGQQYTNALAKDAVYTQFRDAIKRVAQTENILLVRRYEAMQYLSTAKPGRIYLAADDFHLNDLGYHCMAQHIARAIVSGVIISPKPNKPGMALRPR